MKSTHNYRYLGNLANIYREKYMKEKNRAWAEINLDNLRHNYYLLKSMMPPKCQFMAVIKANAYGHGDIEVGKSLMKLGCRHFAAATVKEGIHMRRHGLGGEILILGYTHPHDFKYLRRYHLTQTVIDAEYGKLLNSHGTYRKRMRVQVKIDTGMNRLGEKADSIEKLVEIYNLPNIKVCGTFSHLCSCDSLDKESEAFTRQQIDCFRTILKKLHEYGCDPGPSHIQSSYGLLHYPNEQFDYVRIGIALYGSLSQKAVLCGEASGQDIGLKPVLSLKSRIALLKNVPPGGSVSYGCNYRAKEESVIAAVPIGYADGLPRCLNGGIALVNGQAAPIVGNICMDQCLLDVTKILCREQDEVTFIGKSGEQEIRAESVAQNSGTITNDLFTGIGNRIERIYMH